VPDAVIEKPPTEVAPNLEGDGRALEIPEDDEDDLIDSNELDGGLEAHTSHDG